MGDIVRERIGYLEHYVPGRIDSRHQSVEACGVYWISFHFSFVRVWNIENGRAYTFRSACGETIRSAASSRDGKLLWLSFEKSTVIEVYSVPTFQMLTAIDCSDMVTCRSATEVLFLREVSPFGLLVLVKFFDGLRLLSLYDSDGRLSGDPALSLDLPVSIDFEPEYLLFLSATESFVIWSQKEILHITLAEDNGVFLAGETTHHGAELVLSSYMVDIVHMEKRGLLFVLEGRGNILCLTAECSYLQHVQLEDANEEQVVGAEGSLQATSIAATEDFLLVGLHNGSVAFFDGETLQRRAIFNYLANVEKQSEISIHRSQLAGHNVAAELWHNRHHVVQLVPVAKNHESRAERSPLLRLFVVYTGGSKVVVDFHGNMSELSSASILRTHNCHHGPICSLSCDNHNSQRVLSTSVDGKIGIWHISTAELEGKFLDVGGTTGTDLVSSKNHVTDNIDSCAHIYAQCGLLAASQNAFLLGDNHGILRQIDLVSREETRIVSPSQGGNCVYLCSSVDRQLVVAAFDGPFCKVWHTRHFFGEGLEVLPPTARERNARIAGIFAARGNSSLSHRVFVVTETSTWLIQVGHSQSIVQILSTYEYQTACPITSCAFQQNCGLCAMLAPGKIFVCDIGKLCDHSAADGENVSKIESVSVQPFLPIVPSSRLVEFDSSGLYLFVVSDGVSQGQEEPQSS